MRRDEDFEGRDMREKAPWAERSDARPVTDDELEAMEAASRITIGLLGGDAALYAQLAVATELRLLRKLRVAVENGPKADVDDADLERAWRELLLWEEQYMDPVGDQEEPA